MKKYVLWAAVLFCVAAYLVAVKFPLFSAPKPVHGKIQFFEEDEYWSIYHFYGLDGGVKKEVAVSAFNQEMKDVEYMLKVSSLDAQGMEEEIPLGKSSSQTFKKVVEFPLLTQKEKLQLVAKINGAETVLDEEINEEKTMPYTFSLTATHPPDPLDYGMFLLPKDKILVTQNGKLHLQAQLMLPYGKEKNLEWKIFLSHRGNLYWDKNTQRFKVVSPSPRCPDRSFYQFLKEGIEKLSAENTGYAFDFEAIELPIYESSGQQKKRLIEGSYGIHFVVKDKESGAMLINETKILLVAPSLKQKISFGAKKAKIDYTELVYIHSDQKSFMQSTWFALWKNGPHEDIVVHFPGLPFKLLFWRGASYIPVFTFGNIGITYEWIEAAGSWGRPPGTKVKDCVEPLMDKECRFSRVKIISSSPARVVVHWRYALIDLNYYNPDNEWVDEYYYIYPDGYVTRVADAKLVPNTWHEQSEFIVLIPPGYNPFELIEDNDVTILSPDGKKKKIVSHPKPDTTWELGKPTVYRVHLKNNPYTPIMVTPNLEKQSSFDGWQNKKRYVSPSYWGDHWPVTRGFETRNFVPEFYKARPTHASLVSTYHKPLKVTPTDDGMEKMSWVWLLGITKGTDEQVLKMARNFLTPPQIIPEKNLASISYDMEQRAYILNVKKGAAEVQFSVKGNEEILHPVFVLKNTAAKNIKMFVDNKPVLSGNLSTGVEGKNTVMFGNIKIMAGSSIKITLK